MAFLADKKMTPKAFQMTGKRCFFYTIYLFSMQKQRRMLLRRKILRRIGKHVNKMIEQLKCVQKKMKKSSICQSIKVVNIDHRQNRALPSFRHDTQPYMNLKGAVIQFTMYCT